MGLWDWSTAQDLDWASPQRSFPTAYDIAAVQPYYKHEIVKALDTGIKYQGDQPVVGGWVLATGAAANLPLPYPGAATTGPQAGTVFTPTSGTVNSSAPGQVISGLNITGDLIIRHINVTVRDCIINCTEFAGISTVGSNLTGCLIERTRINGISNTAGISPDSLTGCEIRFCDINHVENGIFVGANSQNFHDNYIHDLTSIAGDPHIDGIQGTGGFTALTIDHNTIISNDTSCIILQNEGAGFSGAVINNNRLIMTDGAYCCLIQDLDGGVGAVSNITVTNNRMDKGSTPGASYGFFHNVTGLVWTGNFDDVTAIVVGPDIG